MSFIDRLRGEHRPKSESVADRQIRLARESGQFDNLPGTGKPLPGIDEVHDDDWWIKEKLRREKVAMKVPPTLEIRFAKRDLLAALPEMVDEQEVRRRIEVLNKRIAQVNRTPCEGPPSTTSVIDVIEAVRIWRGSRAQGENGGSAGSSS
jgi:Domain of unknown function (DUF1992)